jgi:hypothetical protein
MVHMSVSYTCESELIGLWSFVGPFGGYAEGRYGCDDPYEVDWLSPRILNDRGVYICLPPPHVRGEPSIGPATVCRDGFAPVIFETGPWPRVLCLGSKPACRAGFTVVPGSFRHSNKFSYECEE